jgi:ABC-type transport system substrate-binding protein/Flp pilus assembly protein TadD
MRYTVCVGMWLVLVVVATAAEPLYLHEPYDELTLNERNEGAVLQVRPIDLGGPPRKVPATAPEGKLTVRLLDQPEKAYELDWSAIAKISLFEDRLLFTAQQLMKKGKFDEAYEYFQFLRSNYPKLEGLEAAFDDYLYEEAKAAGREGRFDNALAMLRELYQRNPSRAGLQAALVMTSEKLVEKLVAAEDFAGARLLVRNLQSWFPKEPAVAKWQTQFQGQAATLLKQAEAALKKGEFRKADEAARRVQQLWPQLAGAKELCAAIHAKYGRVVVGVTSACLQPDPGRIDDWAARRTGHLVHRLVALYSGPGSQGGNYLCPIGKLDLDKSVRKITLKVAPDLRWSAGPATLTGADVAHRLLTMADPTDAAYQPGWADLLGGIELRDVYNLTITFRHPCVRPEAWLETYVLPYSDPALLSQAGVTGGPYRVHGASEEETRYVINEQYGSAPDSRPREISERYFREKGKALSALRQGRIQVLDRLNPWEVPLARGARGVVVEPYAVPLVHCLVPNLHRPLMASRTFRRALVYGVDRKALLDALTNGQELPGTRVISGPFAATLGSERLIHYAYDDTIKPRDYDPRLALILAAQAREELIAAEKARGRESKGLTSLLLAHPGDPVARMACGLIREQLQLAGIAVSLKELAPGAPARLTDDVDLLYAELAAWEPVVDARRILGEDGLAGGCSAYMSLALRQLDAAADWGEVRSRLRQIHRVAHADVAVVPLYQLTDHLAYHESVQGIGTRPVVLYQNVSQWQAGFTYSSDP